MSELEPWPDDPRELPPNSFAAETGISIAFIVGLVVLIIVIVQAISK